MNKKTILNSSDELQPPSLVTTNPILATDNGASFLFRRN